MMWPCSNRWAIFCQRQGIDAAFDTLQAMATDLKLASLDSSTLPAANTSDASQASSPINCAPFANSQREISHLLHIIWTKYRTDALKRKIPDYISFADLIFATGSRRLGLGYLQDRLIVSLCRPRAQHAHSIVSVVSFIFLRLPSPCIQHIKLWTQTLSACLKRASNLH